MSGLLFFVDAIVKPILRVKTDEEFVNTLCNIFLVFSIFICGSTVLFPTPYGRYSVQTKRKMATISIPWTYMLLPHVVIPLVLLANDEKTWTMPLTNWIVLSFFVLHYAHR